MREFDLIDYFSSLTTTRADVIVGIGDDCAVLDVPSGKQLLTSLDTLVAGVHFPESTPADAIGYKAAMVNLSDLAACGAEPAWMSLALSMPTLDDAWCRAFAQGFFAALSPYNVALIGGDVTQGPLTISCQVHGFAAPASALTRQGARIGDAIYVTGTLGDASAGLAIAEQRMTAKTQDSAYLLERLYRPTARVEWGQVLVGIAHAAIDVSDGLFADLSHILQRSGVGAAVYKEKLPLSPALRRTLDETTASLMALGGGDDYELCFTVSAEHDDALQRLATRLNCPCQRIGTIEPGERLRVLSADGTELSVTASGFEHFRGETS